MTLKKCRECNAEVSSEAKTCPKCGISEPVKKPQAIGKILLGLICIPFLIPLFKNHDIESAAPTPAAATVIAKPAEKVKEQAPLLTTVTPPALVPSSASAWEYSKDKDEMSDAETIFAALNAQESLNFDFPYQGKNYPTLTLRKKPKHNSDVILEIDKGQFMCHTRHCSIKVRFDDGPTVTYQANPPSDSRTTAIFITPPQKFISALKGSKEMRIEATFFHEGSPVMIFKTAGLNWK